MCSVQYVSLRVNRVSENASKLHVFVCVYPHPYIATTKSAKNTLWLADLLFAMFEDGHSLRVRVGRPNCIPIEHDAHPHQYHIMHIFLIMYIYIFKWFARKFNLCMRFCEKLHKQFFILREFVFFYQRTRALPIYNGKWYACAIWWRGNHNNTITSFEAIEKCKMLNALYKDRQSRTSSKCPPSYLHTLYINIQIARV